MDTYERLQAPDLAQAATVEAIFVYNTAMRDQCCRVSRCRILSLMSSAELR